MIQSRRSWFWTVGGVWLALCCRQEAVGDEQRPIVAVFDIEDRGSGLPTQTLNNLTDYLAVLLTNAGLQVIPRDQIRERLRAQKEESQKGCYEQSCQVELGRELAAQKSLSTRIFKIGGECRMTVTLYDLKRAATDKAQFDKAPCSEDALGLSLEKIVGRLTEREENKARPADKPVSSPLARPADKPVASLPARPSPADSQQIVGAVGMPSLQSAQVLAKPRDMQPARGTAADDLQAVEKIGRGTSSVWGHLFFWSGVGFAALGGAAMAMSMTAAKDFDATGEFSQKDKSKTYAGFMYAGFGVGLTGIVTGVWLWVSPSSDAASDNHATASFYAGPSADRGPLTVGWTGRW